MNASRFAVAAMILVGVALAAVIIRLNMPRPESGVVLEPLPENAAASTTTSTTPSTMNEDNNAAGLVQTDVKVGTGAEAVSGKEVTVHYVGTLDDGTKFDSSRDRGTPFTFALGAGQVIKGWDLGVAGMKVGGIRTLVIPANLAYGNQAVGSIPPGSTLHFEVELLGVK